MLYAPVLQNNVSPYYGKPPSAVQQVLYVAPLPVSYNPTVPNPLMDPVWPNATTYPIYTHHMEATKLDIGGGNTRIFCSWSQHPLSEDGPGQYVRYVYSNDNCNSWSTVANLFDPPQVYAGEHFESGGGLRLQNAGFITVGGTMYAMAQCLKLPRNEFRTFVAMLIREVSASGLGTVYRLGWQGEEEFPSIAEHTDSAAIKAELAKPWNLPQCCKDLHGVGKDYRDDLGRSTMELVEPDSILLTNGDTHRLWRVSANSGNPTTVMHESVVDGTTGIETYLGATPMPNDPSRTRRLRLSTGDIVIAGNLQAANNRRQSYIAVSNTECASWQRLHKLWYTGNTTNNYKWSGLGSDNRGTGQGYPAMVEHDGWLHTFWSLRKEYALRNSMLVSEV